MRIQCAVVIAACALLPVLHAQANKAKDTGADWPMYNRDPAGTRYSPLTAIDTKNVSKLTQAWSYRLREEGASQGRGGREGGPPSEATPIVVNGVMYLPASNHVAALEPETGKEIWRYELNGGAPSRRGVAYWPGDRNNPARIIFTAGRKLIALNAKTGKIDPGFGKEGEVDMTIPYNAVPTVYKNVVIVGANVASTALGPPGDSRAYDARTGAKLWDFHSVPQPGEVGHETWEGDSWKGRSGTNTWEFYLTLDEQRGIVYMPFASPTADYYGGDRKGANLFGNSLVALDATTGKYKWHFQTIHHDLWDADPPAAPGLIDIVVSGKKIPALAQVTKSGWMFILDRVTGKPVFGVEERPVPKSDVPGEQSWPTQPFPLKPPPLARVGFKPEDLVTAEDTTPEHAKACRDLVEKNGGLYNAGPFTPWLFRAEGAPPKSSVVFPGGTGGPNWGGTASDPKLGYLFVNAMDEGALGWIEKTKEGSPLPFDKTGLDGVGPGRGTFAIRVAGGSWPCQKPPWGRLTAVNANTGDIAWQVPLGITEELPEGKRRTGRAGRAGPIVTAGGLVFIGATNDNRFRALDAKTGKELWVTKLDRTANATPMTYQGKNGKQYVAVVASDFVAAFALP
jgi:glucose dehydrogenase